MATEQIMTSQINGFSAGGRQETKFITLSGGVSDQTTSAFGFVVGLVVIELLLDASNDGVNVNTVLMANMRSFSGTKTANVTDRIAKGPGNGGYTKMLVDRTTSGTVIVISQPSFGTDVNPSGSGIAAFTASNWPNPGRLRVTAFEDTQS